ncbi:hypothetical protein NLO413_0007 [Candidatus Neoehrlichia lotoris str. RAC413]|uniref:Uncharacterized protein n=1 Tax=Candidatus Neoehrlichia procyonis str. RAC413 TaxID=1359163 RepID=A0A0F3NLT2_9RICK|nr:hypothetical protein NLO413_0007 [Candidatus Neoehrlichia lotoris str. RAC413]
MYFIVYFTFLSHSRHTKLFFSNTSIIDASLKKMASSSPL